MIMLIILLILIFVGGGGYYATPAGVPGRSGHRPGNDTGHSLHRLLAWCVPLKAKNTATPGADMVLQRARMYG